jgi:hypothetical protein
MTSPLRGTLLGQFSNSDRQYSPVFMVHLRVTSLSLIEWRELFCDAREEGKLAAALLDYVVISGCFVFSTLVSITCEVC